MTVPARLVSLLNTPEPPALGPARRAGTLSAEAVTTALNSLLTPAQFQSPSGRSLRALLLLWHDHLEAAHELAQSVENADGSFVHAILHRREPDAGNSNYWWQRVRSHPAFAELARSATGQLQAARADRLARKLMPGGLWDAAAFVDACEAAFGQPASDPQVGTLRQLQRCETEVLLENLARRLE